MNISLYITIFLFTSCANQAFNYKIKEANLDALRFESLNRFDEKRINDIKINVPITLCHKAEYTIAKELLKKQLKKRKDDSKYWFELATCSYLEDDYARAKFYYQLSLGLAHTNSEKSAIFNNLGLIFLKKSKFNDAKEHFKHAITLDNKALTPKFNLGLVYSYFGVYGKSEKLFIELNKLHPNDIDFNLSLAQLYLKMNKLKLANYYFSKIPNKYKSRQVIANNLAILHMQIGDYHKALTFLKNGNKKGPFKVLNTYVEIEKMLLEKLRAKR